MKIYIYLSNVNLIFIITVFQKIDIIEVILRYLSFQN